MPTTLSWKLHNLETALITLVALIFYGTLPLGAVCVERDFGLEEHRQQLAADMSWLNSDYTSSWLGKHGQVSTFSVPRNWH